MARLLIPFLPDPITIIDINTFEESGATKYLPSDRAVRRLAASQLKSVSNAKDKLNGIGSLCVLSIPNDVYAQAESVPGRNQLTHLLGVSGRGYRNTLFIHQTSVHTLPSKVLEPISGVVLGIHLLHGPNITDFSKQTAIITDSNKKTVHDKYLDGYELLNYILRTQMGYGHVFRMGPERHDKIMANIQFLTHSMLLILGDALLSRGYKISPDNFHELPASIYILLGRMSRQPSHVYKGIATGNQFNFLVSDKIQGLAKINGNTELDWLCDAVRRFGDIRDELFKETNMSRREKDKICTPMSIVRDGIIEYARSRGSSTTHAQVNIETNVNRYLSALSSGYDRYFTSVMGEVKAKLAVLDFESLIMERYEALREVDHGPHRP